MRAVPSFSLYGESERLFLDDWLHGESIAARSGRYDWEIKPHRHAHFFQILHLSGGAGEALIEDWRAPLRPICLLTAPAGVVHGFQFSEDVQGSVLTIVQDKVRQILRRLPGLEAGFDRPHIFRVHDGNAVAAITAALHLITLELGGRGAGRDALIEAQLLSLFLLLARTAQDGEAQGEAGAALLRHAQRFRVLLDQHFRIEHSVGFYAHGLGVSETHLNRVCRRVLAKSALTVIHDRLIAEAGRDLAFTTMSVQDVARSLGFEDPAYFSRFFAKATGEAPKDFRRRSSGRTG
jgi:AraC family transcriptional activator of pobA